MDFMVEIKVSLKPGVVDAEGETIGKSLKLLGYENVEKVRTSKVYLIFVKGTKKRVEKEMNEASKKLLANPVIQTYEIKIKKGK